MAEPRFVLFDDEVARRWEPFALTRPAGELVFGALTLRERFERLLGFECAGHLAAGHLVGFKEPGGAPVLEREEISGPVLVAHSRFVPDHAAASRWSAALDLETVELVLGDRRVGLWIPAGRSLPVDALFEADGGEPDRSVEVPGRMLEHVWDLCLETPEQIGRDVLALCVDRAPYTPGEGVHVLGSGGVYVDGDVEVEPGVVLDTRGGPIWLREGVRIHAFTRIAGPAHIGPGSTVLGGNVEAVSVGPVCKIRGELAESVLLGYVNKAHDGHMGHACLGRWVNLGAGTTNSDLKNNYGTIRIRTPDGEVDTGRIKLGCLLGDHVKTGIGLLLNTGTVVGAGSNLFGAEMPPKWVPPFRWGRGEQLVPYRVDKFLEVAERAMARREVTLGAEARAQLEASWRRGSEQAGDEAS